MNSNNIKQLILSAARTMIRPVVRVLIHNGVTYSEFCKLAKAQFVEVCANDFGLQGRPTNMSRIATMTGIDRKEVKRVKDALEQRDPVAETQHAQDRLTRILSAWHQDPNYLNDNGEPVILAADIESERLSFPGLVKLYGGDIPVSTILKELVGSGCIEKTSNGDLRVLKRFYVPANNNPESLLRASSVSSEILNTMFHNLYVVGKEKRARPRFERRASNNAIPAKQAAAFERFVEQEGQALLERVDAWLTEHECIIEEGDEPRDDLVRMGVGAYMIQYTQQKNKKNSGTKKSKQPVVQNDAEEQGLQVEENDE
ncbi:DUF6502 family protein [Marinagarivorans cellulosilyticus]|uniref:Uncharacterized protein n=1 Tax=Marinagarivorans cellulosilyticus TaxID=2721545 RepID=A0AAN1WEN2_9GAMM|nr:DUF6502 family protein [Marinagarivorans cellulosilyticus]BCD96193.1 hypothetical protein MARGE09_P0392 [Marinagarivorans cellulosilyticus]